MTRSILVLNKAAPPCADYMPIHQNSIGSTTSITNGGVPRRINKFPELRAKKTDETNATPEPPQKLPKMTILLVKMRLFFWKIEPF